MLFMTKSGEVWCPRTVRHHVAAKIWVSFVFTKIRVVQTTGVMICDCVYHSVLSWLCVNNNYRPTLGPKMAPLNLSPTTYHILVLNHQLVELQKCAEMTEQTRKFLLTESKEQIVFHNIKISMLYDDETKITEKFRVMLEKKKPQKKKKKSVT